MEAAAACFDLPKPFQNSSPCPSPTIYLPLIEMPSVTFDNSVISLEEGWYSHRTLVASSAWDINVCLMLTELAEDSSLITNNWKISVGNMLNVT